MKYVLAIIALVFLSAPALATEHCRVVFDGNDNPNHQSSLSSTTAGGAEHQVCCD